MRRLIVPSSLVFLAASLCVLAMLSPAGAAGSVPNHLPAATRVADVLPAADAQSGPAATRPQRHPVLPDPDHGSLLPTTTCCPASCCTTQRRAAPACTPGGLTIASSPDPSTAGRKVVISGGLTSNPPWRAPGRAVARAVGPVDLPTGHADHDRQRGAIQVHAEGRDGQRRPAVVRDRERSRRARRSSSTSTRSSAWRRRTAVAAGHAMLLRGHVTPSHAGQIVLIEQRNGGHGR